MRLAPDSGFSFMEVKAILGPSARWAENFEIVRKVTTPAPQRGRRHFFTFSPSSTRRRIASEREGLSSCFARHLSMELRNSFETLMLRGSSRFALIATSDEARLLDSWPAAFARRPLSRHEKLFHESHFKSKLFKKAISAELTSSAFSCCVQCPQSGNIIVC